MSTNTRITKTKLEAVIFFEKKGRMPRRASKNKKERSISERLEEIVRPKGRHFDPSFRTWYIEASSMRLRKTPAFRIQALKDFYDTHGRLPSTLSGDKEERLIAQDASGYKSPKHKWFDAEFRDWYLARSARTQSPALKKSKIRAFYKEHGRFPSSRNDKGGVKTKEETRLGASLSSYITETSNVYDPEFRKWFLKERRKIHLACQEKFRKFVEENGYRPTPTDPGMEYVAKLCQSMVAGLNNRIEEFPEFAEFYLRSSRRPRAQAEQKQ
jgi:hypothetical protein